MKLNAPLFEVPPPLDIKNLASARFRLQQRKARTLRWSGRFPNFLEEVGRESEKFALASIIAPLTFVRREKFCTQQSRLCGVAQNFGCSFSDAAMRVTKRNCKMTLQLNNEWRMMIVLSWRAAGATIMRR
ncbi:hypothetical protein ACSVBT_14065 [Afipia sp. TerB]